MAIIAKDKINIQKSTLSPCKVEDAQVYKFLEKIKAKEPYRNYAIIYTLAYTGLRISECLNIKLNNIDYDECVLHVIRGKGNKDRDVTLTDDVIIILKKYISTYRPNVDSDYLFISRTKSNNYKLTTQAIENVFNKYTTIMTPHTMRHFRANDLVKNSGLMIGQIAEEMGHSNIQTTIGYTYNTASEKREKLNKMKKVG
jgi:integrase